MNFQSFSYTRFLKITCLFFVGLLTFTSANGQKRTKKIDRKIQKDLERLWKDQIITETAIATDVSIETNLFFEDNQLSELSVAGEKVGYLLLRRGYGCQIGGCGTGSYGEGATCSADGVTYETFDYVAYFDTSLQVLKMNVVDYPGDYGYEICSKNWLKQFIGYEGEEIRYKKDIDGISGATISASSITSDIQEVHNYLEQLLNDNSAEKAEINELVGSGE